jgi:hypothetical protein
MRVVGLGGVAVLAVGDLLCEAPGGGGDDGRGTSGEGFERDPAEGLGAGGNGDGG